MIGAIGRTTLVLMAVSKPLSSSVDLFISGKDGDVVIVEMMVMMVMMVMVVAMTMMIVVAEMMVMRYIIYQKTIIYKT